MLRRINVLLLHIVLCGPTTRVKDVTVTMPFCPGLARNLGSEFQPSPLVLHVEYRLCMFDISDICKIMASRGRYSSRESYSGRGGYSDRQESRGGRGGGHASGSSTRDGRTHGGAQQGSG